MPVRQDPPQSILGCLARIFHKSFCGGGRKGPIRLFGMALAFALPFYIILFVYIPSNGLEDGLNDVNNNNNNKFMEGNNDIQLANVAVRDVKLSEREAEVEDMDRRGRVLMKGNEMQEYGGLKEKPAAAKVVTTLPFDNRTKAQHSTEIIGGITVVYMGCYKDATTKYRRALQGAFYTDINRMTIERCLQHCSLKSYPFAGLEFSSECYCAQAVTASKAREKDACNMTCSGNKDQICGGAPYISVYQISTPGQAIAGADHLVNQKEANTVRGYDFRACVPYVKKKGDSIFTGGILIEQSTMTIPSCLKACGDEQHPLAGMARGKECHCGHLTTDFDLQDKVDPEMCNAPCPGDEKSFCGADEYVSIYQTSHQDERCLEMTLKPMGSMPLIAVASFPGSGNTWVRYLIERASGIYTGSYYDDGDLYNKGFKGEREHWLKGTTVAVKTHRFDEEHVATYDGVILIIRDPYKAILSEHNRKFGGHTGYASDRHYTQGTEWIDFVTGKSRTWTNTALNFLQYNKNVLVVHYEDLRSNLKPNLEKMLRFLKVKIDPNRVLCTISSPDGKYKRPAAKQKLSFDPFTDEMKEYVSLYIKAVSMALHITNQTKLPDTYNPHLKFL
ncbi:sialate:O-sulfotransferase 2-like [Apostichopus japonicus]|uniref:sialate:O-sulfotransferase 2-like n=1 Tax=Stichopus japonicus TaxID=307972 RepID=UPI003AB43CF5